MQMFYQVVIYFMVFSIVGWICETIFCTIIEKRFAYRGFLNGPICPVYGFGGLIVVYVLAPFKDNIIVLFLLGLVATTLLEYITSYIMEKAFNTKWWDYSENKVNINGRVCLSFSIMFGLLSVTAVKLIYPPFHRLVTNIPSFMQAAIAWILLLLFFSDCYITIWSMFKINGTLAAMDEGNKRLLKKMEELDSNNASIKEKVGLIKNEHLPIKDAIAIGKEKMTSKDKALMELVSQKEGRFKYIKGVVKGQANRLRKAFPNMESTKYRSQLKELKNYLVEQKKKNKEDESE